MIKEHDVDRIIHTAAYPSFTGGGSLAPVATVHVNVMGTVNVLEAARMLDVHRVVLCSSASLYVSVEGGSDRGAPWKEESYPWTSTVYATTKLATEYLGLNYWSEFGLDVVAVRLNGVFGPSPSGSAGISAVSMERWLRDALAGTPVVIDYPRLEWVYCKDAARGALLAASIDDPETRVFNIGMGVAVESGRHRRGDCDGRDLVRTFERPHPEQHLPRRTSGRWTPVALRPCWVTVRSTCWWMRCASTEPGWSARRRRATVVTSGILRRCSHSGHAGNERLR